MLNILAAVFPMAAHIQSFSTLVPIYRTQGHVFIIRTSVSPLIKPAEIGTCYGKADYLSEAVKLHSFFMQIMRVRFWDQYNSWILT